MQNQQQPDPEFSTTDSAFDAHPSPATHNETVFQPSAEFMQELAAERTQESSTEAVPQQATSETVATASPSVPQRPPFDVSKIYPVPGARTETLTDKHMAGSNDGGETENRRVAARVPLLQTYSLLMAFYYLLNLYYGYVLAQSLGAAWRMSVLRGATSAHPIVPINIWQYALIGLPLLQLLINICLLVTRNVQAAYALLTTLLVISVLGIIGSLISFFQGIAHANTGAIATLILSSVLLLFLHKVWRKVNLERIE